MPPALPAASLLQRLAAGCYDLLLLAGILMLTSFVVIATRGGAAIPAGNLAYQAFLALQAVAFFIGFWASGGQTPGMRAWHIRVETIEGRSPPALTAGRRLAAALISAAALGLGFLWILFDADGRAWHDRLSRTRVVRLEPVSGKRDAASARAG